MTTGAAVAVTVTGASTIETGAEKGGDELLLD